MKKITLFIILVCCIFGVSSISYGQFYPGGFGGNEMPFWLLPTQAYTVGTTSNNGDNVILWEDEAILVGGLNDATQGTVADQPNYNNTGVYGSASVLFDRTNTEWMGIADDNSINTSALNEKMMTMTFRTSNITHNVQFLYEEGGGTNGMAIYLLQDQLYVAIWNYGDATWGNVGGGSTLFSNNEYYRCFRATIVPNTDYLVTLLYDNFYTVTAGRGTFRAFLNGTQMTINDNIVRNSLPVATFASHGDDVGIGAINGGSKIFDVTNAAVANNNINATDLGGTYFQGRIGEITYYNSAKNTERKIVENYFSTKYQFALSADDMYPQNPTYRFNMIGIGRESASASLTNTDRVDANVQSSGGFFMANPATGGFLNTVGDYMFAAHNAGVGTSPDGTGQYSNRTWYVRFTNQGSDAGDIVLSFDATGLGVLPVCANNSTDYYIRDLANPTNRLGLGTGTLDPVTGLISFTIPANFFVGDKEITLGIDNVALAADETGLCNNGCDDDGDGLVDCYDNDCNGNAAVPDPACDDYFFGQVPPDCAISQPIVPDVNPVPEFETDLSFEVEQRGGVFVGDVVPDSWPNYPAADDNEHIEIVSKNPYNTPYTGGPRNGQPRSPNIYIFSGDNGSLIQQIPTPVTDKFSMLALADVDDDGNGDIFITGNDRRLYRYEFDPSLAYGASQAATGNEVAVSSSTGTLLVQTSEMTPALADFDQNGIPEVYVGNAIYNALTLQNLVPPNASLSAGIHPNDAQQAAFPVAYDIYRPGDPLPGGGSCGPECQGLELVTGNVIYAVDLLSGTLTPLTTAPANITDGRASIADVDNNGTVDIVTCGYDNTGTAAGAIFVWSPYTGNQIGTTFKLIDGGQVTTIGGRPNLANVDGDPQLEVIVGGRNRVYCIEIGATLTQKWNATIDETSDRTSGSTFDFNGDGNAEVIYSDEENLLVYNGETGALLSSSTSRSGTRSEYPLVADVDKDGFTELIVTAQDLNGPNDNAIGNVTVYGSGSDWVSSRIVWNQHTYFVTNIEDNLRVPSVQQNHAAVGYSAGVNGPLNSFIKQVSLFDQDNNSLTPTGDLRIISISGSVVSDGGNSGSVDYSNCEATGEILITAIVTNLGDATLPANTPITFFDGDPFTSAANVLAVLTLGQALAPGGAEITLTFSVPANGGNITVFALGNVDSNDPSVGLPQYDISDPSAVFDEGECDFTNNGQNADIGPCLLPVELISLYAENLSEKVVVHWATASELDNDYFLVERAGEDLQFKAIGKVKGKGSKNTRTDYLFNDYEPMLGTSYYRLKQVDFNGQWVNTKIVSVTRTTNNLPPALYPNPNKAGRELYMRGLVDASMIKQLRIVSVTGQEVVANIPVRTSVDGITVISLPKSLSKGIYILNVATDFGVENFKFVIE
ncbi:T9SS type A sorting domain-containing protein [Bernardetia sp.]|uniref:T9SS type A sorting domain-containing protein n=1 Tax=Bernardetia sp. TaxID=1937974 RepID=UPI0025C1AB17|nr:T9SS type A sorting domain-containing protein [Bernardetia sp.]